jgi:Rps23 Pro-64 3,4-dihydroxylase Tpa1-like proline 4-hydroxylase
MISIELNNINYLNNPFPHCVIDNFFDTDIANKLYENINSLKLEDANSKFTNKKSLYEYNKFAFSNIEKLPLSLKDVFVYLNSKEFIKKLEKLTGISGLIYGDLKLRGAGVHIIKNEGFLGMHTDFNSYYHSTHGKLDRRINLLIYMNKDWKSEYKGDLLMYHQDNISEVKRNQPIFNRCVIFNTTNKSVHGHPEPLCVDKEDIYRKSIALYYYTKNEHGNVDFEGDAAHSTLWHKTPHV